MKGKWRKQRNHLENQLIKISNKIVQKKYVIGINTIMAKLMKGPKSL